MRYPDIVKLVTTTRDGYGDRTAIALDDVPAAFIKRHGFNHEGNIEGETSDASVYLLPTNTTVRDNLDELEGMYIHAEPFDDNSWYRIESANVAERKLLNNTIDNVYCRLQKVGGLPYVSVS